MYTLEKKRSTMGRKSHHTNERRIKKGVAMIGLKESMSRLPEEMQAFILSKLDGNTAAVAKRVCKLWNELLAGLETGLHFWLRCCLKEIPTTTLVELTKLTALSRGREATLRELAKHWTDSLGSKLPWMFWREVYAEYYRCGYIEGGLEKKTELYFFPLYGDASCLHIQDGAIYSGHRNGKVLCWQDIEDGVTCDVLYRHDRLVTGLAGLDMVTNTDALLSGAGNNVIVSSSKDTTLKIHDLDTEETKTLRVYSKQVNCVRSWGSDFVAGANGSMLQGQPVWRVTTGGEELSVDVIQELFSQSAADITAVAVWDHSVISGDEIGNIFHWHGSLEACRKPPSDDMCHIANLASPVKCLYLHDKRIVCFTADGFLHVCQDYDDREFVSYDTFDAVKKSPECIAIRASILAIGFQSGFVYLYHLPNKDSWTNLDLSKPASIVNTQQEHVNAVAIGDDGGGPCVVIATDGSFLTVIQWRRRTDESNGDQIEGMNGMKTDVNHGTTNGGLISEDIAPLKSETGNGLRIKENIDMEGKSTKCDNLKTEKDNCVKAEGHAVMKNKNSAESKTVDSDKSETDKEISEEKTENDSKTRGLIVLNKEMMESIDIQRWKNDIQIGRMTRDNT